MRRALAALAAVAAVAGCCTLPFDPQVIPLDAPAVGGLAPGDGVRTVTVQVLAPEQPAPDGTPVIVFWVDDDSAPNGDTRLLAVALRTQDGRVEARVAAKPIHIAAGGGAFTEEWVPDAVLAGSTDAQATVRMYPRVVNGTQQGTWEPAAVSTYDASEQGFVEWLPHDLRPGSSDEVKAGYALRLASARIEVAWTNEPLSRGDLGLAAVTDPGVDVQDEFFDAPEVRCMFKDSADDLLELGARNQTFHSDQDAVDVGCGRFRGEDGGPRARILAGPATSSAAVMPLGLPYTLTYELGFGYAAGIETLCERLPGDVVIAYVQPETGVQGPDQAPEGDTVSEMDVPGPSAGVLVAALLGVGALLGRRLSRP